MTMSMKDLVFKEQPAKKLMERYMKSYMIEEIDNILIDWSPSCSFPPPCVWIPR